MTHGADSDTLPRSQQRTLDTRRNPSQLRGHDTVDGILAAAGDLIDLAGLQELTTRKIAQRAGVSIGALYEYFPNKESVVLALTERWMQQVYEVAERLRTARGDRSETLTYLMDVIDGIAALYRAQPGLTAINPLLKAIPALRGAVDAHNRRLARILIQALSEFAPLADERDVRSVARTLLIIGHPLIAEACTGSTAHGDKLIENLKVCNVALVSRLLLSTVGKPSQK